MVTLAGGEQAVAVIFDFDGVIVDTEPLHYKTFQKVLEPLGITFSWDEYVDVFMGFDDRDAFIEIFKRAALPLSPDQLQTLINNKAGCFLDCIKDGITAYPGAVELIRQIHTNQTPLAIASGALRSDIDPILETLGITSCFDIIVTADDVTRSKPDPESFRLAHQRLQQARNCQLATDKTVVFEDTPAGIRAAKGAGLHVMAITNSYTASHLIDADQILTSLEEKLDV